MKKKKKKIIQIVNGRVECFLDKGLLPVDYLQRLLSEISWAFQLEECPDWYLIDIYAAQGCIDKILSGCRIFELKNLKLPRKLKKEVKSCNKNFLWGLVELAAIE